MNERSEMLALAPCQFCGSEAMEVHVADPGVQCQKCPAAVLGENEGDAVSRWNARAALSVPQADAEPDAFLTPRRFLDAILSACDSSNWGADRNTGDYYKGLCDAYEAVLETTLEFQTPIYAWCRRADNTPAPDAERMRRALEKAEELYQLGLINAPDGLCDEVVRLRREALSRADEGKESEGGLKQQARNPAGLPDSSGDLASAGGIAGVDVTDHRRQVGSDAPSDPTPPDRREALSPDVVKLVVAARRAFDKHSHPHDCTMRDLDHALEAFSSGVPYDDEPVAIQRAEGE